MLCEWCKSEIIEDAEEEEDDADSEQEDQDAADDGVADGKPTPQWVSEEFLSRIALLGWRSENSELTVEADEEDEDKGEDEITFIDGMNEDPERLSLGYGVLGNGPIAVRYII